MRGNSCSKHTSYVSEGLTGGVTLGTEYPGPFDKHDTQWRFLLVDLRYPFDSAGVVTDIHLIAGSDSNQGWTDSRDLKVGNSFVASGRAHFFLS